MAEEGVESVDPLPQQKKIQIYSSTTSSSSARQVTPYWRDKYERDARKYWDIFYKRHQDKFFKDRHYLDKEWGHYFHVRGGEKLVVLEVGCGAGNTIFPLVSTYPNIFVHGCDFSSRAIDLVKAHKDFTNAQINAFVCDLTVDDISENISPSSVDIVTMVFMLSAVTPEKMHIVLQNIRKVVKPNGHVLLRDYATGDLAQERLTCKDQQLSDNFYVRGDGTRAFYFSNDFLTSLFTRNGFDVVEVRVCHKQVENRSLELLMNRRWIQAVLMPVSLSAPKSTRKLDLIAPESNFHTFDSGIHVKDHANDKEFDMSESFAELFHISHSTDEVMEIKLKSCHFWIKGLGREHQHTCKSTGLMLWESARLMCMVLAENPSVVSGKRVLELGSGSAGICSMVAVRSAEFVVSTDGDTEALGLLRQNVLANVESSLIHKLVIKRLIWGHKEDENAVKDLLNQDDDSGFDFILGTDVTYKPDAISPLFETARELISDRVTGQTKPALVLCHIQRRVDEDTIISSASRFGFRLMDRLVNGVHSGNGIISSWFSGTVDHENVFKSTTYSIMYFQI